MNINISNFNVFPLFPSTIGVTKVKDDLSSLQKIKDFEFNKTSSAGSTSYVTKTYQLFSEFEKEKQIIKSYFDRFKNDVLRLENTNFEITTSWATKCETGSHCHYHNHKNSYYSGVLYLDDVEQGGELEFVNTGLVPSNIMINRSTDVNIFNSEAFFISPEKNLLLFFPSYLMHKINTHIEERPRFSIAFNFMPVGSYGDNDSSVDVQLSSNQFSWKKLSIS